MRAGGLDRRVVFWRARAEKNSLNEAVQVWYPLTPAGVAARRRDVSDAERVAAQAVGAVIEVRFVVRRTARTMALTPADRMTSEGVTFAIVGIKRVDGRKGLELSAKASADPIDLGAAG